MGLTLDGVNGISATGNIISSQGFISATGNIYAGNLITALSTIGNVSGTNILASGSMLAAGTMSSTGAATHASLSLGTPLPVDSGGTGRSALTENNVLLGNGSAALQLLAPGAVNNVLVSNGTTWVSGAVPAPVVVFDGQIPYNTVSTFTINPNKLTVWFVCEGNGAGGNQGLFLGISWGAGALTNSLNFFNAGVNFQVTFAGSLLKTLAAGNGTTLLLQPYGNNIGGYGAPTSAPCLVMQF